MGAYEYQGNSAFHGVIYVKWNAGGASNGMSWTDAFTALQSALDAAQARLREGTIDIVTLSTTETSFFQNQDTLEQVRLAHFEAATSLYQALGGGWAPTNREVEIARADAAYQEDKGPWP